MRHPRRAGDRAGIVTTVKDFAALADSWCAYHLSVGFDHLFIYFDDAAEMARLNLLARFSSDRITCIPHDDRLRTAWKRLPRTAEALIAHASEEVQTRQQLNARHAMGLAVCMGLDWLLHIDADELFHPGACGDAASHFRQLAADGVETFCYMNYEAVPEAHGVRNPFGELSLFKRCIEAVKRTPASIEAVNVWLARSPDGGSYFYYYDNGKAAVRVHPEATTLSVHEWLPGTPDGTRRWYSNLRDCWKGRGQLDGLVKYKPTDASACTRPNPARTP